MLGAFAASAGGGGLTPSPGPVAFVQALLSNQSKTSGTSLSLTGSKTVTAGNHIFVAFGCDPGTQTGFTVTDNLGNTYSEVKANSTGSGTSGARARLWKAYIEHGGTLTSISISWTGSIAAKAAVAGEYSGVGTLAGTDGLTSTNANVYAHAGNGSSPAGGAVVYAAAIEQATTVSTAAITYPAAIRGQIATAGGASNTNITVALLDRLTSSAESYTTDWPYVTTPGSFLYATATGTYNPA